MNLLSPAVILTGVLALLSIGAAAINTWQSATVQHLLSRTGLRRPGKRRDADTDDGVVMVWNATTGHLTTIHPDTRQPFTVQTATEYAETLGDAEVRASVNGGPFAKLHGQRPGKLARLFVLIPARAGRWARRAGALRTVLLVLLVAAAIVPTASILVASATRPLNVGMYRGTTDGRTERCTDVTRRFWVGGPECHAWTTSDTGWPFTSSR